MERARQFLPLFFILSFIFTIFFYEAAKSLLSISMFGLLGSIVITRKPKEVLANYWNNKVLLVFSTICLVLPIFILLSENISYAWNRTEIKSPALGLAIAFASIGSIDKKHYNLLLGVYAFLCFFIAGFTLFNYVFNYDEVNESYLHAKVMPSILNHVRLSLMLAMGAYLAYYLFSIGYFFKHVGKWVFLCVAIFLFIFLHVYSVRSGLVAIYSIILVELIVNGLRTKRYLLLFGIAVGLVLGFIAAVKLIPTLNNKWTNTTADIQIYLSKGHPNYNSLTTRFISYDAAISIFKKEPILGCGLGDIKDETDAYFKTNYPMIDIPILPHNEFLFYLAATGIIGLLVFCFTFYFPLFYNRNWNNKILLMQYVILTVSFMTEPMLETQLGMAFSVLFIMLPLTQKTDVQLCKLEDVKMKK